MAVTLATVVISISTSPSSSISVFVFVCVTIRTSPLRLRCRRLRVVVLLRGLEALHRGRVAGTLVVVQAQRHPDLGNHFVEWHFVGLDCPDEKA